MLSVRVAGDPDSEDVVYTNLSSSEIAENATQAGTPVSDKTVSGFLNSMSIGFRKMAKTIAGGLSPDREQQFDLIDGYIDAYQAAGNPVFSVDTKSKEFLGRLYRAGRVRTSEPFKAFDHDFPTWADGVVIPHGIYDIGRNAGHINIGLTRETSRFATDSLRW